MSDETTHDRRRATILLGPFDTVPFATGLRNLLTDSGEFEVVTIDDPARIVGGQVVDGPAILIVEGTDPALCQSYIRPPIRTVVLFDPAGASAFVGVDNPDWRELADVIRATVGEAQSGSEATSRVRVVDPRRLPGMGGDGSPPIQRLTTWLDLRFGLQLRTRVIRSGPGVPGWSVAPAEALELLGLDSEVDESELARLLEAADRELIVSRSDLPPALADIAEAYGLSNLELRVLCLILAPEIDGRYATAVGVLQDDLTRRRPGLSSLAELLATPETGTWDLRRMLLSSDSLVSRGLVRPGPADGLAVDVGLEPVGAVVGWLLSDSIDAALATVRAHRRLVPDDPAQALERDETELVRQLEAGLAGRAPVVHLVGGDRRRHWFDRIAGAIGVELVVGDLGPVEPGPGRRAAVDDWAIVSRLTGSGLVVLGADELDPSERRAVTDALADHASDHRLVATDSEPGTEELQDSPRVILRAPAVTVTRRTEWWRAAAVEAGLPLAPGDAEFLAATVRCDHPAIERSAAQAARQRAGDIQRPAVELAQRAARALTSPSLPPGVRRIEPIYEWDDLVLAAAGKELLRTIPAHVIQAGRVMEDWGFASRLPYGQGVAALFSGPSGTGKTMAAQVIAHDLGVDLLQVDLSKTVSKYIGETEKNLDLVFEASERTASVLLFDEADAIFGKRTEIKDAHDRHANVEVAYLLQRIEAFCGLVILTTNLKQNIDTAFVRRLRFVVDFALPNAAERALIWRKAFPAAAPLSPDVDLGFLAKRLAMPGGNIQSVALHAAFLAAADGGSITSDHLLVATRRELVKIGMVTAERGLDELAA